MERRDQVLNLIKDRRGQVFSIVVPQDLTAVTGGLHSAALLSQLLYWTDRAASDEGWVYKTCREWCAELGLSLRELNTARRRLRALGLTEESYHMAAGLRTLHLRPRVRSLLTALEALPATSGLVHPRDPDPAPPAGRSRSARAAAPGSDRPASAQRERNTESPPPLSPEQRPEATTLSEDARETPASLYCRGMDREAQAAMEKRYHLPRRIPGSHYDRLLSRMEAREAGDQAEPTAS